MPENTSDRNADETNDGLPPAAHPPVRADEPAPLDEVPVPPLTEPGETKGG